MKCEDCGEDIDGHVCKKCGLVLDSRPIASNSTGYVQRRMDATTLYSANHRIWQHPLSPNIRPASQSFKPRYQKKYLDYVYIKAYESISKLCAQLKLPNRIKFEALNLFKGIRKLEPDFFKTYKLAPTYLACIKIACRLNDYPVLNHDLANVIDYQVAKEKKNLSYMEKKFNRAYSAILRLYKLRIKSPKHPNFIDFVCNRLGLPYSFIVKVHEKYTKLRERFQPHFRIEGYILAIIYLLGHKMYGFYLKTLERIFHTSSKTIINRKNEIEKYDKSM
jgi:transcription initiation factor TFIIIB Brf1 subunit/transcription initiation factor TFIIB